MRISKQSVFDIAVVAALAFSLRFYNLENYPRWYVDEGTYVEIGRNMLHGKWGFEAWGPNFFPPLLPLIEGLTVSLFGSNYLVARFPSALMGTLSCIALYVILRKLGKRSTALLAATLLAFSAAYVNRMVLQDNAAELFTLLAILWYVTSRDHWRPISAALTGVTCGLAFLSKYTGIAALIFLGLQSVTEKSIRWFSILFAIFLATCSIYPLVGVIFNWNSFIFDTLHQATRAFDPESTLYYLTVGAPANQVENWFVPVRTPLQIWSALGVFSIMYVVAAAPGRLSSMLSNLMGSLIVTAVLAGTNWWAYLAQVYPYYALAVAALLTLSKRNDPFSIDSYSFTTLSALIGAGAVALAAVSFPSAFVQSGSIIIITSLFLLLCVFYASAVPVRDDFPGRLVFVALIALVILALLWWIVPSALDLGKLTYFLVFGALLVVSGKIKRFAFSIIRLMNATNAHVYGPLKTCRGKILLSCLIILTVSYAGAYQVSQIGVVQTADQVLVVGYVNSHATHQDMVAANDAINWLLTAHAVNYAEVAFYTTHEPTYTYIPEQLSRFRMNISLWNCKYIVLDTPWLRDKLGGSKSVETLTPIILQTWTRVYAIGDYGVYENPNPSAYPVADIYGVRSTFSFSEFASSMIESLPMFSDQGVSKPSW